MVMRHLSEMFDSPGKEQADEEGSVELGKQRPSVEIGGRLKKEKRTSAVLSVLGVWKGREKSFLKQRGKVS